MLPDQVRPQSYVIFLVIFGARTDFLAVLGLYDLHFLAESFKLYLHHLTPAHLR